jgi:hypothetical protein
VVIAHPTHDDQVAERVDTEHVLVGGEERQLGVRQRRGVGVGRDVAELLNVGRCRSTAHGAALRTLRS